MSLTDFMWAGLGPAIGWVWSVEKRLIKLDQIKETTDRVERQVEKLVDNLIEKADDDGKAPN